jgi:HEAT repeat-containing protein 6
LKKFPFQKPPSLVVTPLRIECLQVLFAMSSHFHLLQGHLAHVAEALKNSFADPSFDVKLYAGRVLDTLGHTMATYLLEHKGDNKTGNDSDILLNSCLKFWLDLIPDVTQAIQNDANSATLRTVCCDALANIGPEVFERLPVRNYDFIHFQSTNYSLFTKKNC